MIILQIS